MKKVLIAPLDWGLGHATRCIPIIRELLNRNCEVNIAGSGDSLALLKKEFPALPFFELPGYQPVYSHSDAMVWKMARQLPRFVSTIRKEHQDVEQIIKDHKIELVISDNRYGCWSATVPCVFITHQSNILMPHGFAWLARWVGRMNDRLMKRFSFCWIPDSPMTNSLSGKLTSVKEKSKRIKFIGNLSRFTPPQKAEIKYDVVCVFSGPEPQRGILEKIVVDQLQHSSLKYFVVRGVLSPDSAPALRDDHSVDFLPTRELQNVIEQSDCVIARSGFSTVMDLAKLGKKAIFIPTPGQTEQEYLAERLMKKKIAYAMDQNSFELTKAWEESKIYGGFNSANTYSELLGDALDDLKLGHHGGSEEKTNAGIPANGPES